MIYGKLGFNRGNFDLSNTFIYNSPNKPSTNLQSDSGKYSMSASGPSLGIGFAKEYPPFTERGMLSNLTFFWRVEYRRIFWDRSNNFQKKYKGDGDKSISLQHVAVRVSDTSTNTYDVSTSFLPRHSDNIALSIGIRF